ncbi:MAG: AI-2E family transporter, partial [Planctomycetota bacterium]
SKGVLVLIFFGFLVFGGSGRQAKPGSDWAGVEADVKRYALAKLLLSAATGVLVGLILWVLGIPLAGVFGMLAFLLNFIPSIGSIVAVLLPLPVVLLSPDISTTRAVLAILLPGAVEFAIGNVIEPRLMGKRLGLHPIAVIMALIFWGMLWGVVGMFLAVPMTVLARRIMLKSDVTRPAAELLAGNAPD